MIDEKDKTESDNEHRQSTEDLHRAEPGQVTDQGTKDEEDKSTMEAGAGEVRSGPGVLLLDRPPRPGTIEFKGPPGMAVSVAGDEWCTKIVLHLPIHQDGAWTP